MRKNLFVIINSYAIITWTITNQAQFYQGLTNQIGVFIIFDQTFERLTRFAGLPYFTVNPTQFDNSEDLKKYPKSLEADMALLASISEELIVFAPSVEEIYAKDVKTKSLKVEAAKKALIEINENISVTTIPQILQLRMVFDPVTVHNPFFTCRLMNPTAQ